MSSPKGHINDKGLLELAKRLNYGLFEIRSTFYVWKYLVSLTNTTVVGQEDADKNVALINLHKGFFIPVINSLQCQLIIEIDILFDSKHGRESISNLVDPIRKRGYDFQKEYADLKKEFEAEIILIEKARNQLFAHKTIKRDVSSLPGITHTEDLLAKLAEFLSRVAGETFGHSWHIPEEKSMEANQDTKLMFTNLIRGESVRLTEIEAEFRNYQINN